MPVPVSGPEQSPTVSRASSLPTEGSALPAKQVSNIKRPHHYLADGVDRGLAAPLRDNYPFHVDILDLFTTTEAFASDLAEVTASPSPLPTAPDSSVSRKKNNTHFSSRDPKRSKTTPVFDPG